MAQTDRQTDKAEKASPASLVTPEFAEMGKKRLEELVAIQSEQLKKLQEVNQHWLERMQSEATLASEFTAKLTAARSMPEVATAYQEWTQRHMEMAADDAKRIFDDGQKLAETGARLLSSGWHRDG
jgi:Phasin protein